MENITLQDNRAFLYGDAVFETVKILDNKILFLENHYFRLMSSMRILRMEIPMNFTMEFFEEIILSSAKSNNLENSARARITIYRKNGGLYLPTENNIEYLISISKIETPLYEIQKDNYEVDLYKDFYISKQLISTLKTTNRLTNITASIFAKENELDNCILINEDKNIIEAINGNIFMLKDGVLSTPPTTDGCINGILRKEIIALCSKIENITIIEASISSFDLQKADELFITNVITGIQPITKYRKKEYTTLFSKTLLTKLNAKIRLAS